MKTREITVSLRCHETWLLCVHEKHTQSIPMLWRKNLSFWSKTQTMRKMSNDVENPDQEARSTSRENSFCFAQTNLSATAHSRGYKSASSPHAPRLESSVSKSSAKIRSKEMPSKISSRPAYPLARWNMVRFQKSTLDSLPGRPQTDQRPLRNLFGSFAFQRDRKLERMGTIHRNHPFQRQKTHLCRRMRQFSRCQETRLQKSLDPATVSFSFNPSIPIKKRTLEAWHWSPQDSRINLSTGSSSPGAPQWSPALSCIESPQYYSALCTNSSAPHASSRILTKHQLLPKLSNSSNSASTKHEQHHRINEPFNPRLDASMRESTNSGVTSTLDNSFYTYAT